jgi:GT2 family glycosyltransferase
MISLLIIAHEEHEKLSLHLPALLSQEGAVYEVVVVDMNSEDDTLVLL